MEKSLATLGHDGFDTHCLKQFCNNSYSHDFAVGWRIVVVVHSIFTRLLLYSKTRGEIQHHSFGIGTWWNSCAKTQDVCWVIFWRFDKGEAYLNMYVKEIESHLLHSRNKSLFHLGNQLI